MINIQRTRPLGITILAVLVAVYGILGLIGGVVVLGTSLSVGIIALILGVLELVLAWGLWTLQRWAFWTTAVIEGLAVLDGIFAITQRGVVGGTIGIVI